MRLQVLKYSDIYSPTRNGAETRAPRLAQDEDRTQNGRPGGPQLLREPRGSDFSFSQLTGTFSPAFFWIQELQTGIDASSEMLQLYFQHFQWFTKV